MAERLKNVEKSSCINVYQNFLSIIAIAKKDIWYLHRINYKIF